jgi:hypothetical protein
LKSNVFPIINCHRRTRRRFEIFQHQQQAAEIKAKRQLAIAAVLKGEDTCHSPAIAYGLPCRTLYNRVNGNMKPRNQSSWQISLDGDQFDPGVRAQQSWSKL